MKKLLSLLFLLFLTSSCVTNYYFVNLEEDTPIYKKTNTSGEAIVVAPKGYSVYISSRTNSYRKIKWKNYKGWAINPVYNIGTTSNYNSKSALSNSTYNSSSTKSSSGGTVQVKGYYRKSGTYVKPHTRSAPRRK
ncbi:hypothetical protein ACMDB5_08175 [Flavobacterium sp. W1B]|uniref:hypothetical protein n=1 Tax=Flavobacterium sp. W1B TaxID=3394146 RepID=UPI0039BD88D0